MMFMTKTCTIMRHAEDAPSDARRSPARPGPWLATALGAVSLLAGGSAGAATILSAAWNSGCSKETCFNDHGAYSVTFSASAFSGPVDVSHLLLDRNILGTMGSQFFSLNFLLNGQKIANWGDWNMRSVGGDELSFWGPELTWNPTDGDLVLTLELVAPNGERLGGGSAGGYVFEDGGRPENPPGDPGLPPHAGQIPPTGGGLFSPPPPPPPFPPQGSHEPPPGDPPPAGVGPGPVPEPSTWLLMIGGFGMAGAALRRRRLTPAV